MTETQDHDHAASFAGRLFARPADDPGSESTAEATTADHIPEESADPGRPDQDGRDLVRHLFGTDTNQETQC